MSQLELALWASTTPRHVSFIETGRSRPGRELVLRLAACMDLPIRDRNALLVAAGLHPAFAEHGLDDEQMRPFRIAIQAILDRHDPYPGSAIDHLGRVLMTNAGSRALFPEAESLTPEQMLDGFLAPGPGRDAVENWAEVAWAVADRLRHDAASANDPRLTALAERALKHLDGVERPRPDFPYESPVMCVRLRVGNQVIPTFSTVMRFETPHEVTISELRVELMFPMDEAGAAFFRSLTGSNGTRTQ